MGGLLGVLIGIAVIWLIARMFKSSKSKPEYEISVDIDYSGKSRTASARGPKSTGVQCWRPKDQRITVGNFQIPGGMIYTGQNLTDSEGYHIEPALIDPTLKVNVNNPDHSGQTMSYWPRYGDISPQARAAYLYWLSEGRKKPGAYIGYVFLFFYGLERRLLVDGPSIPHYENDAVLIAQEVKRLLALYGSNGSFHNYASGFLSWIALTFPGIKQISEAVDTSVDGYGIALSTKIELARCSLKGLPIPAKLALAWIIGDPDTRLGVAASRCKREFETLFKIAYRKQFGSGLTIKPNRTLLSHQYRPASGGIPRSFHVKSNDLPDVTRLKAPVEKLRAIARACVEELGSYSRAVGKLADSSQKSIRELALLPSDLLVRVKHSALQKVSQFVQTAIKDKSMAKVPVKSLLTLWPTKDANKFNKKEHGGLAALLQALGYGIEPDPRYGNGRLKSGETAILFQLGSDRMSGARDAYLAATLLIQLSSAVAASDGDFSFSERRHLENRIEKALHLESAERLRLTAHLAWQAETPISFAGVAKRIEPLTEAQRKNIGEFLVTVAGADGVIDPAEIRILEKIYRQLHLSNEDLHSTIHQYELGPASEPVMVQPATAAKGGLPIPPPPDTVRPAPEKGFRLDMARIQKKMDDTQIVQQILKKVFDTDDVEPIAPPQPEPSVSGATAAMIEGLDEAHSKLFSWIAELEQIPAAEFEELCEKLGLMPGGAIETLNDIAFEVADDALIEDEDPLTLNKDIAKAILDGNQ